MRKYPKRCPKCNEYMEPVFDSGLGLSTHGVPNINQQPIGWRCDCGFEISVE